MFSLKSLIKALSPFIILGVLVMIVSVITFIVFIERSQRRVLVQYPKRQVGNKVYGGQSSHLPIKLNSSGVIPPIFASALLGIPVSVLSFMPSEGASGFFGRLSASLQHDQPLYFIIFISLISFFAFLIRRKRQRILRRMVVLCLVIVLARIRRTILIIF